MRKQQKKSKKFYFFENGIARVLAGMIDQPLSGKTYEYGQCFESFIINEIHRLLSYKEEQYKLSFLRVSENQEIDLIVEKSNGDIVLCEIKSTEFVDERHTRGLKNFLSDFKNAQAIVISNDT